MQNRKKIFLLLLTLPLSIFIWSQSGSKNIARQGEEKLLQKWFGLVEDFMDSEEYDSAQYFLTQINKTLGSPKEDYHGYFLSSRQAEVYYYNNLPQIGLRESFRALSRAKGLNDSMLIADSYNFNGLFYMNMDSLPQAITHFRLALIYIRQPPYVSFYSNLSYPYHIHGNMAETYQKLKAYDSAIHYAHKSLTEARQVNRARGEAIALQTIGDCYKAQYNYGEAVTRLLEAKNISFASGDYDVSLLCYSSLGNCYAELQMTDSVRYYLQEGTALIASYPNINRFFSTQFLTSAYSSFEKIKEEKLSITMLKQLVQLQKQSLGSHNRQLQNIFTASINNEKRLLELEVADALQKQRLANSRFLITLISMALMLILFWLYTVRLRNKQTLSNIRDKISRDLHDDIGASLSSLNIYASIAQSQIEQNLPKTKEMLGKISDQTVSLLDNMDDIIWSISTHSAQHGSLDTRIKNYGADMLSHSDISVDYNLDPDIADVMQNMLARKNIWLICKEAINNLAKYSEARQVKISAKLLSQFLEIKIEDNGKGFDVNSPYHGNGLKNMRTRCEEIGGEYNILSSAGKGTVVKLRIPKEHL
jgi:signal transduction histidine kinase